MVELPESRTGRLSRPAGLISQEDRADWKRWADAQAQDAFHRGDTAWKACDTGTALIWMERAHRLAPESPNVAFFLAIIRHAAGQLDGAIHLLRDLTTRFNFRQGHLWLAMALFSAGNRTDAEQSLGKALSGHGCDDELALLAERLAPAAGWCAMAGDGTIRYGLPPGQPAGKILPAGLELRIDGAVRRCTPVTGAGHALRPTGRRPSSLPQEISLSLNGMPLLGSPIRARAIRAVEGLVRSGAEGITGWVWHPRDPDRAPELRVLHPETGETLLEWVAEMPLRDVSADIPLARWRAITIPGEALPDGLVRVVGPDGRDLSGSPIDWAMERRAAAWAAARQAEVFRARPVASVKKRAVAQAPSPLPIPVFLPVSANLQPVGQPEVSGERAGIAIVMPVYADVPRTLACIDSVLAAREMAEPPRQAGRGRRKAAGIEIIVVDDAGPDAALAEALDELAAAGAITLLRHPRNLGFPSAANTGMRAASGRDVILLNSDTLVTPGWIDGLRNVAYAEPGIGTVTPLSNNASIVSYPDPQKTSDTVDLRRTRLMAGFAQKANGDGRVEIPTAHGFCMYIRHDCLAQTGLLRDDVFAQGYGEENDFSLRARILGWRHVAATGAFVAHVGSASFGGARDALLARNLDILNRLHPGYDALIAAHIEADPLFDARRRIDLLRWRQMPVGGAAPRSARAGQRHPASRPAEAVDASGERSARQAVVMITHDQGGGVERVVQDRARRLRQRGVWPVILRPVPGGCRVETGGVASGRGASEAEAFPNLRFRLPEEWPALLSLLSGDDVASIEWHHMEGHHPAIRSLAQALGTPYDVFIHDYVWFCPRIALVSVKGRHCDEPDAAECEICISALGRRTDETLPVAALISRSGEELAQARRVIVPSRDAGDRMLRHFPQIAIEVEGLEDDRPELDLARMSYVFASADHKGRVVGFARSRRTRICVIGGIGLEKGYDVLLRAGRDAAARNLPIEYVVVGHTPDDDALMATGHIFVTGAYDDEDAVALVRAQAADYALLPSVWPETWCFALGIAWRAGLNVAAFDLGAIAERIRRTGRGVVFPVTIPAEELNVVLLSLCHRSAVVQAR